MNDKKYSLVYCGMSRMTLNLSTALDTGGFIAVQPPQELLGPLRVQGAARGQRRGDGRRLCGHGLRYRSRDCMQHQVVIGKEIQALELNYHDVEYMNDMIFGEHSTLTWFTNVETW